jgi:hypothetical protein
MIPQHFYYQLVVLGLPWLVVMECPLIFYTDLDRSLCKFSG